MKISHVGDKKIKSVVIPDWDGGKIKRFKRKGVTDLN